MRILINCCILFLLAVSIPLGAQDFITLSPLQEKGNTDRTYSLMNYDSSGYYVMRFKKGLSYAELEHHDPTLKIKKTYVVTTQKRKYVGLVNLEGKLSLLYFRYVENKRDNTHERVSLYAIEIQPDSFQLATDSIELIAPFKMESNFYRVNFAVSPDRTKVLVYDYEEEGDIDGVQGLSNEITLRVFDNNLQALWERHVNLSPDGSAKRSVSIQKLRINNQGEVAILTDIFRDQRSYSTKEVTADPTLFFVGKERKNFSLFQPNMGDYFFNQSNFTFDRDGNILWFGFYSKQRYYQQSGTFFIKINQKRTKVLVKERYDFTPTQMADILNKKRVRPNVEARSFKLVHWRLTKDGGIVFSAEQQPGNGLQFRSHDIIAIKIGATGNMDWLKHVFKHGEEVPRLKTFLSHYLCAEGSDVYLLYNQGLYADGYAAAVKINAAGEMRLRKFYQYQRQQELLCPKLSFRLNDPRIFICFQDRYFSDYRFGILDLNALFKEKKKEQ
ncbi:MAG: hypothetical protein ACRBFS_05990 [Aureispira sp.]